MILTPSETFFLAVGEETDLVILRAKVRLEATGIHVTLVPPAHIGDLTVSVRSRSFYIGPSRVNGIIFRTHPGTIFSGSFVEEDRAFCNAEVGAVWLAALQCGSLYAVNRYDALTWFGSGQWLSWNHRLREASIPVAEFSYSTGSEKHRWWYPYATGTAIEAPQPIVQDLMMSATSNSYPKAKALIAFGSVVNGNHDEITRHSMEMLRQWGIYIAEITTDEENRVLLIDTNPQIGNEADADEIAKLLVRDYESMSGR